MKIDDIVEIICRCLCEDSYIRFPFVITKPPSDTGQEIVVTDSQGVVFSIEINKLRGYMNRCVYEFILEPDDTFVFSCKGDREVIRPSKKEEAIDFDNRINLTSDTLKVADSDVDKYVFDTLRSLREHLLEEQNVFVAKKSLGNGITEVAVWGRKGIGANISDRYIFFLNAKE